MRIARLALGACLLLCSLAGCGSGSTPAITVSCSIKRLPSGLFRASVTLKNTTSATAGAFLYGPALTQVRHIFPVLAPAPVTVQVNGSSRSYVGFFVPRIRTDKPKRVFLRLAPPLHGTSLVATLHRTVQASDWHVLDNTDCVL